MCFLLCVFFGSSLAPRAFCCADDGPEEGTSRVGIKAALRLQGMWLSLLALVLKSAGAQQQSQSSSRRAAGSRRAAVAEQSHRQSVAHSTASSRRHTFFADRVVLRKTKDGPRTGGLVAGSPEGSLTGAEASQEHFTCPWTSSGEGRRGCSGGHRRRRW